jgi:hypothetical protein
MATVTASKCVRLTKNQKVVLRSVYEYSVYNIAHCTRYAIMPERSRRRATRRLFHKGLIDEQNWPTDQGVRLGQRLASA